MAIIVYAYTGLVSNNLFIPLLSSTQSTGFCSNGRPVDCRCSHWCEIILLSFIWLFPKASTSLSNCCPKTSPHCGKNKHLMSDANYTCRLNVKQHLVHLSADTEYNVIGNAYSRTLIMPILFFDPALPHIRNVTYLQMIANPQERLLSAWKYDVYGWKFILK